MSQYQPQENEIGMKNGDFLAVIYMIANIHVTCVSVFIRRGFGREGLAWNGFLAMFLLLLLTGADKAFLYYFALWFMALVMQRIRTFWMLRKGVIMHSKYAGYPYWAMKVPFVRTEETARGFIEPMFCLIAGALLCQLSVNLGGFVMLGLVTFIVRNGMDSQIDKKRLERIKDNAIEAMWYAEQMKKRR